MEGKVRKKEGKGMEGYLRAPFMDPGYALKYN